jgi:3-phenylpropionate/trans-cinnamate dioxygenase ferredoxin component
MNTTPYRILGSSTELADNCVNPYYVEDLKHRVAVARIRGKLFAFDDLYKECPLSAGLLTGTTIMSQGDGSQFDVTSGVVLRGPATARLATYEVRDVNGQIEVRI